MSVLSQPSGPDTIPSTFDPTDPTKTRFFRLGVWDIYESHIASTWAWLLEWSNWPFVALYTFTRANLPYVIQMIKDVWALERCRSALLSYFALEAVVSVFPAVDLWIHGKIINVMRLVITGQPIDIPSIIVIALGQFVMLVITVFTSQVRFRTGKIVNAKLRAFYSIHMFNAFARLDVPTFEDPSVKTEMDYCVANLGDTTVVYKAIQNIVNVCSSLASTTLQIGVVYRAMKEQQNGFLMAFLASVHTLAIMCGNSGYIEITWAATTRHEDYIRTEGLRKLVTNPKHRKEIVGSGIYRHLLSMYTVAATRLGEIRTDSAETMINEKRRRESAPRALLIRSFQHLPSIIFITQAIRQPKGIPTAFTSMELVQLGVNNITFNFGWLKTHIQTTIASLESVKRLYDAVRIPNRIRVESTKGSPTPDLTSAPPSARPDVGFIDPAFLTGIPFPEDSSTLASGISIEFRNVSFKYPGTEAYVLRNASFKIERGQLCVMVGVNGSGKSTILKLVARLYDPNEGQILVNGHDIKTLALFDLRYAMSILFQDYTMFPLTVRDNIALGDPSQSSSPESVQQAAELGGADTLISKLPLGYDTYLEHPAPDQFSSNYQGPSNPFTEPDRELSGGQQQRVALSRTFMKTVNNENSVGLLMFDEPSAALDPIAERDLFERLRRLRGNKTMIFSSHRFGNLTRHADLILYMHESRIVESGTHKELLDLEGEYARLWNIQATAFL